MGDGQGAAVGDGEERRRSDGFEVHLDVFEGPFDLLLALIAKHKLDITEVALSRVTDEFIAHIRAAGPIWDLEQTSHFLLVAATLLDLKAARLLPSAEVEDEADLALLEARDLLFAKLLQYKAYKEVAGVLAARLAEQSQRYPRVVPLEPALAALLPEVLIGLGPQEFAALAARALTPRTPPAPSLDHIHTPRASVREQADILAAKLRRVGRATFRALVADCAGGHEVVARFLALLELYREAAVSFEQPAALGELYVTWSAPDDATVQVADDYDAAQPAPDKDDR